MIKIDEELVKTMFLDGFEYEVNDMDDDLNELFLEYFPDSIMLEPAHTEYNQIVDEVWVDVNRIKVKNTVIKGISFDIQELENGHRKIIGKADIAYNIIAIQREIHDDGYGEDYEDYEITDGSDVGSCTVSFSFIEKYTDTSSNRSYSEFDSHFEVLYE